MSGCPPVIAFFEGADNCKMSGWRPWMLLIRGGERRSFFGHSDSVMQSARLLGVPAFREGEWEAGGPVDTQGFPAIRESVLDGFQRHTGVLL